MPELPEVETTRRGIAPLVEGRKITGVVVREHRLRWPVTRGLVEKLIGQKIHRVSRRAKYLLLSLDQGTLIIHLGMSGRLWIVDSSQAAIKHDHVDIALDNGKILRFHDPRRFGAILWTTADPESHKLLRQLGPEPLGEEFTASYLYQKTRGRKRRIRDVLLDSQVVAGIGNIYANEALYLAGIDPRRAAGRISRPRIERLVSAIVEVLKSAIRAGGTTLRDFRGGDGRPGYFQQTLNVYGRAGQPCPQCGGPVRSEQLGGRSLYFCRHCQK
ncbi:MAG: bifunctional DNA-formamidopyrimidine glycosylase/DNA-(apurinic or apyrimidinic site) lyase [Acidiferrobacterales bacterium]|nr:bifunctional DNA-formamidopyrimidine glycosylase/DNA-(apurinic or apyrimidinic site) lyase [Acidiferrobacterales bacterium]